MKNGLYEKLIDIKTREKINSKEYKETRNVDNSELPRVLSTTYQKIINETLSQMNSEKERVEYIDNLNKTIGIKDFQYSDKKFKELITVHDKETEFNILNEYRPKTPIPTSTLFIGNSGPTLESELSREIRTVDGADFLISFIKYSGLRLIYDDLVEFTKKNKLRVITTSYMGASDYKAILKLSKLPNTEVKISYDTKRTRLHAKAYYFKRNTGFSTAYIGSSNLSNPALSNGLEWNLKVSEYTSKDVVDSFKKTFETYWNDEEFRSFEPTDEDNKRELKESLSTKLREENSYIFFDLKPYSHQKEILEDLRVEREEYDSYKNLAVAATGAGKTTIINLITRFYEIQKGEIRIDGTNIKEYKLHDLRKNVAVVLQDVFLFSGDIKSNIRLNSNISDEDIEKVIDLSYSRDLIDELPKGIDEPVRERGSTFSTGQRQLLSFARAIAHNPSILVLDEATANIDTKTELLIQKSIDNISKDRTTLIIAHRLSTIRQADTIIFLDKGRIMEIGNHEELLENGKYYRELYEAQ